ncbi:Endonuclease/exonuclease/phosphatase, partial [Parasponia andersonii]
GDFNAVLDSHETIDTIYSASYFDFASFLGAYTLIDLDTRGTFYTRISKGARGLVLSRLDRALCTYGFIDLWSNLSNSTLPCLYSDHYPLFLLGRDSRAPYS